MDRALQEFRKVAEEAARHLSNRSDWVMCHLDVDVVDPTLVPAVNYPTPGGLTVAETAIIVRSLLNTGKMRAFEIAAFNPQVDGARASAATIVELVSRILS